MIKEHDAIILTEDLPGEGLQAGDIGRSCLFIRTQQGEELDIVLLPRHKQQHDAKLDAMQEAMNDELFLTGLRETMEDFRHIDAEETPA
jgi:hypothetical protein